MRVVGIDIGTTSTCGISFDLDKQEAVNVITKNTNAFIKTDNPWKKIQSVKRITDISKEILDELLTDDTVSIGITGQMHGIVYTDRNGSAISPLYTWQDARGTLPYGDKTYCEHLDCPSGYGSVTDFYNRVNGIRSKEAVAYCTIGDYFAMYICGVKKPLIHITNSASFGNKDSLVSDAVITNGCETVGTYKNIPVSVAIGDNQASVFASLKDENDVLVNIGTGSQVSLVTDTPIDCKSVEVRPYFDGKYLIVGAALCGGRAYAVLKDFYLGVLNAANVAVHDVYSIMSTMIDEKSETTLKADTRFEGTRTDGTVRGSISNISTSNFTAPDLTYAVLCGIANELYEMYSDTKIKCKGIVASGNGIRFNRSLQRIVESRFGGKLKIPVCTEDAAFGAALFSLLSIQYFSSVKEVQSFVRYI